MRWEVAEDNLHTLRCLWCGTNVARHPGGPLVYLHDTKCVCGQPITDYSLIVRIQKDSAKYLDAVTAGNAIWYHTTLAEDWMEQLETGEAEYAELFDIPDPRLVSAMVHLGDHSSALDRAIDLSRDILSNYDPKDLTIAPGFFLYAVRILPETEIDENVQPDENEDAPCFNVDCEQMGYSSGVTRYVNMYESPGSISLLANRRRIEIVSKERLS